jgi:replicative DNA helicase
MSIEGKVPKHDLDSEASTLSAVLNEASALELIRPILGNGEVFYSPANGDVYKAMCAIQDAGRKLDITTVAAWLRARGWIERVGGAAYLAQLVDATPSIHNVEEYAQTVRELADLRAFQTECHRAAAMAYFDVGEDVRGFMSKRLEAMAAVSEGAVEQDGIMLGVLMQERFKALTEPEKNERNIRVRTGLASLDRKMGVLKGGDVLLIGAHSGVGKTSLAKNIAVHIAKTPGRECANCGAAILVGKDDEIRCEACGGYEWIEIEHHVAFFSPEMTEEELHDSIVFSEARAKMPYVDFNGRTHIHPDSFEKLTAKLDGLARLPIKIFCRTYDMVSVRLKCLAYKRLITRSPFCAKCRTPGSGSGACGRCGELKWKKARLAAFVVDYVQLMKPGGPDQKKSSSREQEVAAVGRMVKNLAKELMAVGIDLAQLNKDSKKEKRKPTIDDIRESSAPAYDANKVILIWNPSAQERVHEYADVPTTSEAGLVDCVDLIIAKCRGGGRTGIVRVAFHPEWTLFDEWPEGMPMPDNKAHSDEDRRR